MPSTSDSGALDLRSLSLGLSCYLMWGFFPLYFHALAPAGSIEVIVHRAIWGLLTALLAVFVMRRGRQLQATIRDRGAVLRLSAAGWLIVVNWTVYVYAVQSGHTIDAALGYFINPLVTVALARFVLHEALTRAQKVAIFLGCLAVVILVIGMGRLPWISLALALSFGLYSLVKKTISGSVPPLEGLVVETAAVTPFLIFYYVWLAIQGTTSFNTLAAQQAAGEHPIAWGWHAALLVGAGILTVIPLVLFAKAAQGLPLGVLGLIQYVTPVMQMAIGILVFHEEMEPVRWVGTAVIWLALVALSVDWIGQIRRSRRVLTEARALSKPTPQAENPASEAEGHSSAKPEA